MMAIRLGIFLFSFSVAIAQAASFHTAKIYSGLCQGGSQPFLGSGFLFSHEGRAYVITSEHVLIHSSGFQAKDQDHSAPYPLGSICHFVESDLMTEKFAAVLRAVEWGNGLALLELPNVKPTEDWVQFKDWNIETPLAGTPVLVSGFPHESRSVILDEGGRVLVPESQRHLFVFLDTMIEIVGAHGEFGMSGGPVLNPGGSHLVGMLSHQFLKLVLGGKTVVGSYSANDSVLEGHLLAIPARTIVSWLQTFFRSPDLHLSPCFQREAESQLLGKSVIIAGGLRFETETLQILENRSTNDVPIGGGDGYGIGGIGGNGGHPVFLRVSQQLGELPFGSAWYLPARSNWIVKMTDRLNLRQRIEIPFMIRRDPETRELSKAPFDSLEDFFSRLKVLNQNPATFFLGGPEDVGAALEVFRVTGKKITELTSAIEKDNQSGSIPLEGRFLLRRIQTVGDLLQGEDWMFVEAADLRELSDTRTRRAEWKSFFAVQFDGAVELLRLLNEVLERIERMKD